MKFFDFFCGAGGVSFGLSRVGFTSIGGLDKYEIAGKTYEQAIKSKVIVKDAFRLSLNEVKKLVDSADVIVGCPPCQGFSIINKQRRVKDDKRNDLVLWFTEVVEVTKPQAIIFENVPPVRKDPRFLELLKVLDKASYGYAFSVVNMADYGVPQARRRLVLIGVRGVKGVELPEPDYGSPDSDPVKRGITKPWRTVRDAIGDLPPVDDGECHPSDELHCTKKLSDYHKDILRQVPKDGGSYGKMYASAFSRLWWGRPSITITTKFFDPSSGRFAHPEQDRGLSLREGARLQTFPDDYPFAGSFRSIARQIGEAVPPLFVEKLGKHLKSYL